eukprot:TRINITY_DN5020_c0_g1_i1.p1 TRINITY_DN5020_c0_g1~~TRINITY_DN5020_c0_g1_i1.p1  ORF type:complete len:159 (-),score=16.30 TRINITY_DN5020_c0_g1_i1:691-1128(-)
MAQEGSRPWSSGLFSCCDDVSLCCLTCWCPCVTAGQIVDIVEQGQTSCAIGGAIYGVLMYIGVPCIYSCGYRTKMRAKYGLMVEPCNDFLVHCCCETCALCQEHRELKNLGFDPALGWSFYQSQGAQPAQAQFVVGKPPAQQTMG